MTDWTDLDPDAQAALIAAPSLEVDAGCELLGFDLTVVEDISTDLDASTATVQWNGNATVHRGCSVTLSRRLNWGSDLIRLYQTLTDEVSGVSARRNLGVFCLTEPDQPIGETPASYQVTGQDRLFLLNRQVGYSYVVYSGTNVLAALAQVFVDAGLTGVQIDSSKASATTPTDMVWPLIPATDTSSAAPTVTDTGSDATDPTAPATWLRIVNDLGGLIAYRGVWADENGLYQLGPYTDPSSRAPTFTWDANSVTSVVGVQRTVTRTTPNVNKWIFVNTSLPDTTMTDSSSDEIDVPAVPVEGDGIYTVVNASDGPASVDARNGLVWPTQINYAAADQASLESMGDNRVAADKRTVATAAVTTAPFPAASHFDIFTWVDSGLDEQSWKVEATTWEVPLDGGDVSWGWQKV